MGAQGLAVDGLADGGGDAGLGPAVVLGYGTPSGRAWQGALDPLCRLLEPR